jgi:hypothetical protein
MRNRNNHRPASRLGKSVSDRREDSEMWAKSVEKPKELGVALAVEPFLVNEETAARMLGLGTRTVWQLGEDEALQIRRIGRRKLYLVSSLKAFAENGKGVE